MELIDFNTAKLLKERGYDAPCGTFFWSNQSDHIMEEVGSIKNYNITKYYYSRPNLHEVCDWLREVKGIHVYAVYAVHGNEAGWVYTVQSSTTSKILKSGVEDTHNEALSAGITQALKTLECR